MAGGTQGKMFIPTPLQPLVTSTGKHTTAINVGMFMRRLTSRLKSYIIMIRLMRV